MKKFLWQSARPATFLLGWLALAPLAGAEDLTTLSGVTYRQVRAVRAEPDGVIWEHATGICKVDFSDLPETVRKTYHYDAGKVAAYQAAQSQTRQQAAEQPQRNQQEFAARRAKLAQELATETALTDTPGNFTFHRRAAAEAPDQQSFNEWIAGKKAAHDLLTKDDGTIWDRRLWAIPCLIVGGYNPGIAFDPKVNLNPQEYQASLHGGAGGIFNPIYLTRSYYQDVERAEAFARGHP